MVYKLKWIELTHLLNDTKSQIVYTEMFNGKPLWYGHEININTTNKKQIELFLYYCVLILKYDLTIFDIYDKNDNLIYFEKDFKKLNEYEKHIKKNQGFNSYR
jgi:hypothetical protein